MERSYLAYQDAVALAPEDVGIVNDCALILVYHLQRDADAAEALLLRALELGEKQLPELVRAAGEEGLDAEQKSQRQLAAQKLRSAVGDAWQNLGVLCLTLRGDARKGLLNLEKCRGMGPDPRPEVFGPGGYLEQAHAALAGTLDPRVVDATRWAAPCKDK
jgi:tetratricopeptide (TPR) repeat protein